MATQLESMKADMSRKAYRRTTANDKQMLAVKLKALFEKADAGTQIGSNDGNLSPHELKFNMDRKEMLALLKEAGQLEEVDTNDDGKVSLEELLDRMDADDDGHISLEEFLKAALPQIIWRRSP